MAEETTTLSEDQKSDMACKIDSEGFDYYFRHGGWWEEEAKIDPKIRVLAEAYCAAAEALESYLDLPEI